MKKFIIKSIEKYQNNKALHQKKRCKYYPTCSNYALDCFRRFNIIKASFLSLWRLIRCNPWSKGGYDPAPEKKVHLKKVDENLYYLPNTLNTDRPNICYIKLDGIAYQIDSGTSKRHLKLFYKELRKNKLSMPLYTFITHKHWDHNFANYYLKNKSIGTKETNDYLLKLLSYNKKEIINSVDLFSKNHIRLEYKHKKIKIKPLDIIYDKKMKFEGIKIIKLPSNHTNENLSFIINKTLISSDAFCGKIIDTEFKIDKNIIQEQINLLNKLNIEYVLEGHSNIKLKSEIIDELYEILN